MISTWSIVFALATLAIVGGAVSFWLRREKAKNLIIAEESNKPPTIDKWVASRFPSPTQEATMDLVKQAMQVRDPARVPEFFRLGSTTAAEVVAFLESKEEKDGPITKYQWLSSVDANNMLIDGVAIYTKLEDKPFNRLAFLTPDEKGKWKIDFEAFARTVKPSWQEVLSSSPDHDNIVRVLLRKDTYYNGPFSDETKWICCRLGSPDLSEDILGYCRQNSPQATALRLITSAGPSPARAKGVFRATLVIRHVKGAEAKQYEITSILAEDWVINSKAFDSSFK